MNRIVSIAFAIIALPALAFAQGIVVTNQALLEVKALKSDGQEEIAYVVPEKVTPGDAILYQISYVNTGDDPAEGIMLTSEIPSELRIAEGSAETSSARVQYSVDGGKSFADRASLVVVSEDGTTRPAEAADLTNVRWMLVGMLNAGESGAVSYRAIVK